MKSRATFVIICLIIAIYYAIFDSPTDVNIRFMGGIGVFTLCYSVYSWYKKGQQLLSPYIVFLVVLCVFSYGVPMLYAFDITPERDLYGYLNITKGDIYRSQWITLIMLVFLHVGALQSIKPGYDTLGNVQNVVLSNKRLKQVGWFLFIISAYPYIESTVRTMLFSMAFGYAELYNVDQAIGLDNISAFFSDLFIPSVLCLFVSYKGNNTLRYIFLGLFLLNVLAIFLTGGRTNGVILLILILILYNYFIKKFGKKEYLAIGIGVFFLLAGLSIIESSRNEGGREMSLTSNEKSSSSSSSGFVDILMLVLISGFVAGAIFMIIYIIMK